MALGKAMGCGSTGAHFTTGTGSSASALEELVGDLGRPMADWPVTEDVGHLPGESGLLAGLSNIYGYMRHGNAHLVAQAERYGSVYRCMFGLDPIVCVADADLLGTIARNEDRAWSTALAYRTMFGGLDPTTSEPGGLTGLDFEAHRDARKLLQPAFGAAALAKYAETTSAMCESTATDWLRQGRVAFKPAARRLFAGVASSIFLGIDDPEEAKMLDVALADAWKGLTAIARNPLLSPTWRRAVRGHRTLREALQGRVDRRKTGTGCDLFSQLCRAGQDAAWLGNDTIVQMFIGILFAAFDTTSLGATSMAYLLASNPDWQEKLREEGRTCAPRSLTIENLKHLVQHDWVWKESLRLFPIASALPRRPLQDVHVGRHRIPAGALVHVMIGPLFQDRRWWTNPERFDPERFSPERAEDKRHRAAYLPFGAGAHACIGQQLSGIEIKVFWHALLSRCRFRLARDYRARHQYTPLGSVSGEVELLVEAV